MIEIILKVTTISWSTTSMGVKKGVPSNPQIVYRISPQPVFGSNFEP